MTNKLILDPGSDEPYGRDRTVAVHRIDGRLAILHYCRRRRRGPWIQWHDCGTWLPEGQMDVLCRWWLKRQGIDVEALKSRVSDLEDDAAHLRSAEQEEHADLVRARGTIEELRAERDRLRELFERMWQWSRSFGAALNPGMRPDSFGEGVRESKSQVATMLTALGAKEGT